MPRDLTERSYEPEMMDAGIDSLPLYDAWLQQIETLNRLTMGYHPVLSWLDARFDGLTSASILDIGFGRGELLREIGRLAREKRVAANLAGIDTALLSAQAARNATPPGMPIDYRVGNVFTSGGSADFIVCSHMTHHMTDAEVVALVEWMEGHARLGWFICDLSRSAASYWITSLLLRLAPVSKVIRYDGVQSVARSFTRREWQRILTAANVNAEVREHFPFRLCVARRKT